MAETLQLVVGAPNLLATVTPDSTAAAFSTTALQDILERVSQGTLAPREALLLVNSASGATTIASAGDKDTERLQA
eukprot:CAMPEP_0172444482 /NCGR_PEP_ID=MMETSP1065-20121228/4515_1 /TAXON_ID=265537 /ORGANISM="Amphiprora paludosa, Strain CCMP125" /LENGTH=75 /DNA_ID=CAMNT_0013195025 /DNA_START=75 /DNA_END=299 /DNA_ORIENTATION=-